MHCQILEGDCLDILPTLPEQSVDVILTDPPYFMPADHYYTSKRGWNRKWSDTSALTHWWEKVVQEMHRVLKPTGHLFVFCNADSYAAFYPALFNRWQRLNALVWDKKLPTGNGYIWRRQHELIIAARNVKAFFVKDGSRSDILKCRIVPPSQRCHPAEKPVDLLRSLLRAVTPKGGVVLDPFCGSASTGIAAIREGFYFIGIEKEPEYLEAAKKRVEGEMNRLEGLR